MSDAEDFYGSFTVDNKTVLINCEINPGDSFNKPLTQAGTIQNSTFKNLQADDTLYFGSRTYENITLEDTQGNIDFNNSKIYGLHMDGVKVAALTTHGATYIDDFSAKGSHFVKMELDPKTVLNKLDFEGTIIDPNSVLNGATITNANFKDATLRDLDARNIKVTNGDFTGADIKDTDLRGAILTDTIGLNGKPITLAELQAAGAIIDSSTKVIETAQFKARQVNNPAWNPALNEANKAAQPPPPEKEQQKQAEPPKEEPKTTGTDPVGVDLMGHLMTNMKTATGAEVKTVAQIADSGMSPQAVAAATALPVEALKEIAGIGSFNWNPSEGTGTAATTQRNRETAPAIPANYYGRKG